MSYPNLGFWGLYFETQLWIDGIPLIKLPKKPNKKQFVQRYRRMVHNTTGIKTGHKFFEIEGKISRLFDFKKILWFIFSDRNHFEPKLWRYCPDFHRQESDEFLSLWKRRKLLQSGKLVEQAIGKTIIRFQRFISKGNRRRFERRKSTKLRLLYLLGIFWFQPREVTFQWFHPH